MESEDLGEEVLALRWGKRFWVHVARNGGMKCIIRRKVQWEDRGGSKAECCGNDVQAF